jgi:hypothetical protein
MLNAVFVNRHVYSGPVTISNSVPVHPFNIEAEATNSPETLLILPRGKISNVSVEST